MRKLSPEQQQARDAINGQILVVSCPGSGKTTVLLDRIQNMLNHGINPESMLNITFTKAAAEEMENRFMRDYNAKVHFSTIHSFCFRLLCQEKNLSIESLLKESEKWMFLAQFLKGKVTPAEVEDTVKELMSEISYVKNRELNYALYRPINLDKALFVDAYSSYEEFKRQNDKIDFDDMLILCREYLKSNPDVLEKYRQKYQYISVDEFQDVNGIQADICYMLTGDNGNLFVVGDDDQSIYKFRAADSTIMLNFPKKYPNCQTIYMGTNYRSCKNIVYIAGQLINNNKVRFTKDFKAFRDQDGKISLGKYDSVDAQAKDIVKTIAQLNAEGTKLEDIAILYRTNSTAVNFIAELMKFKIPFYTSEVPKSHHDFIYNDITAYYRLSRNQEKQGDLQKILNHPSRYIKAAPFYKCRYNKDELMKRCDSLNASDCERTKNTFFDMFFDIAQLSKMNEPKEFINYLCNNMDYRAWLKSFATFQGKPEDEFLSVLTLLQEEAAQFSTMEDWFNYVIRYEKKLQEIKKSKDKHGVCLSTFHSSKGLEWNNVFVVNVSEGQVPFGKAETPEELEEERRMFYVAITRAKNNLCMCYIENDKVIHSAYFEEMGFYFKEIEKKSAQKEKFDHSTAKNIKAAENQTW